MVGGVRNMRVLLELLVVVIIVVTTTSQAAKPNIIFILTDDQDLLMHSLDFMHKVQHNLIEQGITLSNYFIPTPLCCPSRASILRGQYAHNTDIIDLTPPGGGAHKFHALEEDNSTIGVWLKNAGYTTAFYGKYLNGYNCDSPYAHTVPPGWDDWFALCDPGVYNYHNSSYSNMGKIQYFPGQYQTETLGAKAVSFLKDSHSQNKPFFLHLSGCAPHQPATPAAKYANLFSDLKSPRTPNYNESDVSKMPSFIRDLPPLTVEEENTLDELYRNRLRTLQSVDDNVELIVNTLQSLSILDNTYIFYTADNGFHLGFHRLLYGKREPYEEDIRVPFIVRGPNIPKNISISINAQNIDIAPTIAELAGAKTPDFVDGKSFVEYLHNPKMLKKDIQDQFRPIVLIEHWGVSSESDLFPNNTWQGIRVFNSTSNFLYTSWCTSDHEFYNLRSDPFELANSFNTQTDSHELDGYLHGYFHCQNVTCRNLSFATPDGNLKPLTPCWVN